MSVNFSSALRITGLDDFLKPEKECVVMKTDHPPSSSLGKKATAKIQVKTDGSYVEVRQDGKEERLQPTKISLTDCLACSGCVTTAETVLIESQGIGEFLKHVNSNRTVIVTVSPQSRASLAAYFNLTHQQAFGKIISMLLQLGVKYVFDSSLGEELSLLEMANEFIEKKRLEIPATTVEGTSPAAPARPKLAGGGGRSTMLTGSCPGWICYAEKTHGDLLGHISTTKSAQQIMGLYIKSQFGPANNLLPSEIYHVTIMPCFDRKLEASRDSFYHSDQSFSEVDCVLSTIEILQLLEDQNIDLRSLPEAPLTRPFINIDDGGHICATHGGTSGGAVEFVYTKAAQELFQVPNAEIKFKTGRNPDFSEAFLEVDGKVVLKFARAYGFRNIQNVVRKLKQNRYEYDFVEVMACPGGCTNGGGQIRPTEPPSTSPSSTTNPDFHDPRKLLKAVNEVYNQPKPALPGQNPVVVTMHKELASLAHGVATPTKLDAFHTTYKAVPKAEQKNPLSIKW